MTTPITIILYALVFAVLAIFAYRFLHHAFAFTPGVMVPLRPAPKRIKNNKHGCIMGFEWGMNFLQTLNQIDVSKVLVYASLAPLTTTHPNGEQTISVESVHPSVPYVDLQVDPGFGLYEITLQFDDTVPLVSVGASLSIKFHIDKPVDFGQIYYKCVNGSADSSLKLRKPLTKEGQLVVTSCKWQKLLADKEARELEAAADTILAIMEEDDD